MHNFQVHTVNANGVEAVFGCDKYADARMRFLRAQNDPNVFECTMIESVDRITSRQIGYFSKV